MAPASRTAGIAPCWRPVLAPATFFMRVAGDSMTGAGIQDGDLLIVDRAAEVTSGCIVVARIHDEFTLKRVRKQGAGNDPTGHPPEGCPVADRLGGRCHPPQAPGVCS